MDTTPPPDAAPGVVVVMLVDYLKRHQVWGWMRLAAGATGLREVPGLLFAKVMGSGHGGGFTLRPSPTHQGLICRFSGLEAALDFLDSPGVGAMRERARECWWGVLGVRSSRGSWDEQLWPVSDTPAADAGRSILAVLTRATIAPARAVAFWRHAPAAQSGLHRTQGCLLAVGLGEAPMVRQCTFSLWQDEAAMTAYAAAGAHQAAASAAYRHGYFSESMFVRMDVLRMAGTWQGREFSHG